MATGEKRYRDFSDFLNLHFDCKVQKISLHAGFTCPNRDGSIGVGGCTYCNNQTFSPDYCHTGKSITSQLEEGIAFFARKYPEMHYLAYFQAYTNTYGELAVLKQKYEEALFHPGVVDYCRYSPRLYARRTVGIFCGFVPTYIRIGGVWRGEYLRRNFA